MSERRTMNVSLTPELEAFVQQQVASGRYASASEVVRASLRSLEEHELRRLFERWICNQTEPGEEDRIPEAWKQQAAAYFQEKWNEAEEDRQAGRMVDGPEFMRQLMDRLDRRKAS